MYVYTITVSRGINLTDLVGSVLPQRPPVCGPVRGVQ